MRLQRHTYPRDVGTTCAHGLQRLLYRVACLAVAASVFTGAAVAQNQGSLLPNPRLLTLTPAGGQTGKTVEVTFSGTDVEDPEALVFSHAGIKAEPVLPPVVKADPKKPAPNPPTPKPPITKFKVTITAGTPVGIYDARLVNRWGISNPRAFVVGDLAEVAEKEPNNDVDQAQRIELNTTVDGAINAPTDVDYFLFAGKKGQRVLCECRASSIDSRLQPGIELYDKAERKLGFNRHYNGLDALLDCTLPEDGDYLIRLFEFTYTQGGPEFFYRLTVTTGPWIDAIYPSVVEPGKPAKVTVYGRNLPGGQLDPTALVAGRILEKMTVEVTPPTDPAALQRLQFNDLITPALSGMDGFEYRVRNNIGFSNPYLITYARAPVVLDNEANDTPETAQSVTVPCEIAGRIEKRGDRDWYSFAAKKGDIYNIEVFSERVGAQTDMYFLVRNPTNKQDLGEFDDNPDVLNPIKFFTRTNDPPRFRFVAPADGPYQVLVSSRDADVRASPRQLYRLAITPEQPDFRLVALAPADNRPDACRLPRGGQQFLTVLVWRNEGWNGNINLTAEGLPEGVTCSPQVLGAGLKQTQMVLSATAAAPVKVAEFKIKGTANINGQVVVREARPASITWPVQPGQNIPTVSRLDRSLVLAVRETAPFNLTTAIDKAIIVHGDKANLSLTLARLWPDFKTPPLQVIALPTDLPAGLTVNNNQPLTMAPGKDTASMVIQAQTNVLPGTYNIVLRASAPIPFNKDPKAKEKPPINVVLPSSPVKVTVLPKSVATLSLDNANPTVKMGAQQDIVVKVARMHEFAGEFKVQLVMPPNVKDVSATDVVIPAGKDEAKLVLKITADAAPGNRPNLTIRASAVVLDIHPVIQETKFNLNVVKK